MLIESSVFFEVMLFLLISWRIFYLVILVYVVVFVRESVVRIDFFYVLGWWVCLFVFCVVVVGLGGMREWRVIKLEEMRVSWLLSCLKGGIEKSKERSSMMREGIVWMVDIREGEGRFCILY